MPSLRGRPPTRITQSAPSNASSALSVALTSARSGNAQSSSSISVPLRRGQRRGDLQQAERDRLIGAEQAARGDPEDQGVADLAPGPGDGDADRLVMVECPSFDEFNVWMAVRLGRACRAAEWDSP